VRVRVRVRVRVKVRVKVSHRAQPARVLEHHTQRALHGGHQVVRGACGGRDLLGEG